MTAIIAHHHAAAVEVDHDGPTRPAADKAIRNEETTNVDPISNLNQKIIGRDEYVERMSVESKASKKIEGNNT